MANRIAKARESVSRAIDNVKTKMATLKKFGEEPIDAELGNSNDRFVYHPRTFWERIAVGARFKTKLNASKCVRIPYRVWMKYLLIGLLVLIGAFFTPQLLPKWLGFEWASTKNLCEKRPEKLEALRLKMENITQLPLLRNTVQRQEFHLGQCMNRSAENFYQRPRRFQWPEECTPQLASSSLRDEVCVGPTSRNVCDNISSVRRFFAKIARTCKTVTTPKKCVTVVDEDRTKALLDLEREQAALELSEAQTETQPIIETANSRATEIINRLLLQVDIASDIYIVYNIIALVIGMPLIIYKREKGSRILGATFGLQKLTFVIVAVIILTMYDSVLLILKETDFARLFRNFRTDPCYVDAEFSRERVNLIIYTCNNVSQLAQSSQVKVQSMDEVYFTTRRFGICQDSSRPAAKHPRENDMDILRQRTRTGDLKFPGSCNATFLDEQTSDAPSSPGFSKFKALLGSGVLAQLFLKLILTSWLLHLMAYYEPMIVHNGKVEIWDASKAKGSEEEPPLTESEAESANRFSRDKHLLPLITLSIFMAFELFLIIYSLIVTHTGGDDLLQQPEFPTLPTNFVCPFSV